MTTVEKARLLKEKLFSANEANLNRERFCLQLVETLAPLLNDELYELYKKAYRLSQQDKSLWQRTFQQMLAECPEWDDEIVADITERMLKKVKWFRQVVRQMVIQEIYVLMSSRYDEPTQDIDFEFSLPSNLELMRSILCRVCNAMRGYVYLYSHEGLTETEMAKNACKAEKKISCALQKAIVSFVPTERIVEAHLNPPLPPPKDGQAEDQMVALKSEEPESKGALEVADTPVENTHVDIERQEVLAAAAANDATVAAQEAVQSAQVAVTAAKEAEAVVPQRTRRKIKYNEF